MSVAPASISEAGGEQAVTVTATLDGVARATDTSVTVTFSSDGSAKQGAGMDYEVLPEGMGTNTITTGTITIPADDDSASASFRFRPVNDVIDEGTGETIVITGSTSASDLTAGVAPANLALNDDDPTPDTINLSFDPDSIDEDAAGDAQGDLAVKVVATLAGPSVRTVATTVNLAASLGGTAERGPDSDDDYTSSGLPTSVTIPAGQSSGEATGLLINPTDNSVSDGSRTITLAQGTPALEGFTVNEGTLSLADDELPVITLSVVGESTIGENDSSATSVKVRATLDDGALTTSTTVTLSVDSDSTATGGGTDYTATVPTTLTILANSASADTASFSITPTNDSIFEGDETIIIEGAATGFNVASVTITIEDDDLPDYDEDNDRLIDVDSVAKFNAMRWDTNGDFTVDDAANDESFAAAFPTPAANICDDPDTTPVETCAGYELTADIDLDVDPHNTGAGWLPIPTWRTTFNGDGHRITGLMISRAGTSNVGLFARLAAGGTVRDVALIDVMVTGSGFVGGLAGRLDGGTVRRVYVSGTVSSRLLRVGGIVGANGTGIGSTSRIEQSASAATVRLLQRFTHRVGGIVGENWGTVRNSFATGPVRGAGSGNDTGGLIGLNNSGTGRQSRPIVNSYAIGLVTEGDGGSQTGGLVGTHSGVDAIASYWNEGTTGRTTSGTGTGRTTAQMQAPTAPGAEAGDTYHGWDPNIWDFGTSSQYPVLKGMPVSLNEQRGITIVLTADVTTIAEDASGDQTVAITATRETGPAESDITVALSVEGTATAGMDDDYTFTLGSPSITIATGSTTGTATLTITPNDDDHWEPDETIAVEGTTTGTGVGPAVITLTSDDDPGLRLTSTTTTIAENAGATTVALTVALDEAPPADTTLTLSFSGTATKDADYSVTPTTVTVAAGATSASVNLTITPDDNETRYDETANGPRTIVIGTTLLGYVVTSHTIDLTDDEPIPITLSLDVTTAAESADDTTVTVTATLDEGAQAAATTVQITVGAGESTATGGGTDYSGTSTTSITISAGSTSDTVQISIDPADDDIHEGSETVVIGGTAPSGFGVIPATFTITDDDEAPDQVVLGFSTVSESAGATASTVTATLANSVGTNPQDIVLTHDVVVTLAEVTGANAGTATSGTDYASLGTLPTVTISAGSLSGTASLSINPTDDNVDEGTGETVKFTGTAACKTTDDPCETDDVITGLTVTGADLTITDDDEASTTINLSFSPASIDEDVTGDNLGDVAVKVIATLDGDVTRATDTVVNLATALGGTATSGTDYASSGLPASVTISAGELSGEATGLKINPTDDNDAEGHETITLAQHATNTLAGFTVNAASLDLLDDDGFDYDSDNDQLIEIDSAAKLNAIRWDTNGDGVVDVATNQDDYRMAFPLPGENFCDDPSTTGADEVETCAGYELTADINLDVAPYNTGDGWVQIRQWRTMLDGNGHSISGLFTVARQNTSTSGFIFQLNSGATLEDLALTDARVTRLAGSGTAVAVTTNLGTVRRVFVSGEISAVGIIVGGLVADNTGTIEQSVSAVTVRNTGGHTNHSYGALVGANKRTIRDSFATGSVRGGSITGGLVGLQNSGATSITNSYSTAAVSAAPSSLRVGGLVGRSNGGTVTANYWDTQTSDQSSSPAGTGKTTAELQSPTAPGATATDTYHGWSADVWDFGTSSQYPVLKTAGFPLSVEEQRAMLGDIVLSVDTTSVAEDAGSAVTVKVTATLSGSTRRSATVVALSLGGTATGGGTDYTATALTQVRIPANSQSGSVSFTITPTDNNSSDGNKTIVISGVRDWFGIESATVTLVDDDLPTITLDTGTVTSISEGSSATVTITATLDDGTARSSDVTVDLTLSGATSGTDYTTNPATLGDITIEDGDTSGTTSVTIAVPQENTNEGAKTLVVGGTAAGFNINTDSITLGDNDSPSTKATLSTSVSSVTEAGNDNEDVTVTATLDGAVRSTNTTVSLTFGASGDSAAIASGSNLNDYHVLAAGTGTTKITTGSITITAGQTSGSTSFRFRPNNDNIDESDGTTQRPHETLTISGTTTATGLTAGIDSTTLAITDDDTASTAITLSLGTAATAAEGSAATTATVSAALGNGSGSNEHSLTKYVRTVNTSVALDFSGSTATLNTDYTLNSAWPTSVTISAGNSSGSATRTLTVTDDTIHDPGEKIAVTGSACQVATAPCPMGKAFTVAGGELTVNDNDDAPDQVTLGFTTVSEGAGATSSTVTATLANSDGTKPQGIVLTQDVTVTLGRDAASDTATAGADYTNLQSSLPTVTISAGSLSGTASINITPVADEVDDDLETIVFTATASTSQAGVSLTGVGANLVITEDAPLISSIAESSVDLRPANFIAQAFGTGTTGAELTEVRIRFSGSDTGAAVRIRRNTAANRPDMSDDGLVATLVATSGDLSAAGVHGFTPAPGVTINLGGAATYWVTIHEGVTSGRKQVEVKTNPATTMVTGWSLGSRLFRQAENDGWGPAGGQVLMEVRGKVFPAVTAQFSAASYSATEGGNVSVTVTLSEAPKRPVTIPISAANQNSASDSDYSGVQDLSFGADEMSKSFTFTATDDSLDDNGESVGLSFGTLPSGVTAGAQDTATVNIVDNDDTPDTINLSFDPASVAEDATGNVAVKVVATLAGTSTRTVATRVNLATALGGTATRGTGTAHDYTSSGLPTSVTIPAGQAKGEATGLRINPTDNSDSDGNRTITLAQGTPALSGFTVNAATMTIADDELPVITLTTGTVTSISEGSSASVTITATFKDGAVRASDVTVDLTLSGATVNTDYTLSATLGDITIEDGDTSASLAAITIAVPEENTDEGAKTLVVGGTAAGFNFDTASITLGDNDSPSTKATLSVNPASIDEEDGAQSVAITATLDGAVRSTDTSVTVSFGNAGTAKIGSGRDYEVLPAGTGTNTITSGTITIPANQTAGSTSFRFRPVDDIIDEGTSETITITGSTTASGLTGGVESVDLTLDDDDSVGTAIQLTFTTASTAEGASPITNQRIQARFSSGKARTVATTIALGYGSSSAVLGSDYTVSPAWPTSITIPADQNSALSSAVTFTPLDDNVFEGTDLVIVAGTLSGFTFDQGSISIANEDDAPDRVKMSFSTVSESAGATASTVTATLANADGSKPQDIVLTEDVTVTLSLGSGGTATSGTDYTALQSPLPTVTISAGSLSGTASISITPTADTIDDDLETIPFTATATTTQSGVTLTGVGANLVITEDAALVSSIDESSVDLRPANFIAQAFGTGTTGAELTEVRIRFSGSGTGVAVRIREDNGSNRPDMSDDGLVATLVATSGDLSAAGVHGFTPASEVTINLDGAATYWVTIHEGVTSGRKQVEVKTNPATTMVTGWSLGSRLFRQAENDGWGPAGGQVLMEVRGKVFPAVTAQFSAASYTATEGSTATVTVTLSEAPKRPVVIPISAANQNSASDSDYSGVQDLSFGADETSKSFTFAATDDSLDDDGESVGLSFGTLPSGVTAGTQDTATVSITDNDDPPDGPSTSPSTRPASPRTPRATWPSRWWPPW